MESSKSHKIWLLPAVLLMGALIVSYRSVIPGLVHQWLDNQDYSHGPLMVPVVGYLIRRKRKELRAVRHQSDWRALLLMGVAVGVYVVGELGAELFTTRVSMLLFIVAFVWLLYGLSVLKVLRFPLAFLFLMLPLPGFIYRNITFPLQLLSSAWSVDLFRIFGISAYREGNVIDLDFMVLQVVEACSGLRYILPLVALGILFAYFMQRILWRRLVLVVVTIPMAVVANVLRIVGTGLIGLYWGEKAAEGFFHSFSGWFVFMVCLVSFVAVNALLNLLPKGRGIEQDDHSPAAVVSVSKRNAWPLVFVAMIIVLSTPAIVNSLGSVSPVPLEKPLSTFPLFFEGYVGTKGTMDPEIWEQVGAQEYVLVDYYRDGQPPLNFYVAYYEYQRKAGDFVHSPRLCLPGAGWFIEENRERHISEERKLDSADNGVRLNELLISKGDTKQLTYFWYQGRGRNFTNEFAAKFYMIWDGLWRRRTDGALVRLVLPLPGGETVEQGRTILDPFALAVERALEEYLP
ncbi:MAG TPA: VPLPA-CTERM-specific exosortase XrtD [Desulfobacterales bacterium]|nr:VPLPA-CTERM-specific exosortase XrtD [Desulfobacterales bacterium]